MGLQGGFGCVSIAFGAGIEEFDMLPQRAQDDGGGEFAVKAEQAQVVHHPAIADVNQRVLHDGDDGGVHQLLQHIEVPQVVGR